MATFGVQNPNLKHIYGLVGQGPNTKFQFPSHLPHTPPPEDDIKYLADPDQTSDYLSYIDGPRPTERIAVIGVGYVGIHLVTAFAQKYNVIAFDISEARLAEVAPRLEKLPVKCTSKASDLADADCFLIAVPTILKADKKIDTSFVQSAISMIESHSRPGATVVMESSVAVGMTRSLLAPLMLRRGLKGGMSPEVRTSLAEPWERWANHTRSGSIPAAPFPASNLFRRSFPGSIKPPCMRYIGSIVRYSITSCPSPPPRWPK